MIYSAANANVANAKPVCLTAINQSINHASINGDAWTGIPMEGSVSVLAIDLKADTHEAFIVAMRVGGGQ